MFPESQNPPTKSIKRVRGLEITCFGRLNLGAPKVSISLWQSPVHGTAMPEATVNEYGQLHFCERDVDRAAQSRFNSYIYSIPQPEPVELSSQ
jgi:hypothetical protein